MRRPSRSATVIDEPPGAAKRNRVPPKPSAMTSVGLSARVEQHVAAGDAEVEGALPHVDGDVARTQVVELDTVGVVDEHEVLGVVALPVPGLPEHAGGGLGEGALVRYGDLQQSVSSHAWFPSGHRYS